MAIRRVIIILLFILAFGFWLVYSQNAVNKIDKVSMEAMESYTEVTIVSTIQQKKSEEHPDFVKKPYDTIIPTGINIALKSQIDANSFTGAFTPRKAIDDNTGGSSYWEGLEGSYPNVLILTFDELKNVHAIKILLNPASIWGSRDQVFEIQSGIQKDEFTILVPMKSYSFDPDQGNEVVLEFEPIKLQYLKVVIIDNSGASGGQVGEIRVYAVE